MKAILIEVIRGLETLKRDDISDASKILIVKNIGHIVDKIHLNVLYILSQDKTFNISDKTMHVLIDRQIHMIRNGSMLTPRGLRLLADHYNLNRDVLNVNIKIFSKTQLVNNVLSLKQCIDNID